MNKNLKKTTAIVSFGAIMLTSCAKHTHELPTAYVSPLTYKSYDCSQVSEEMVRVGNKAHEIAYQVNSNAKNDEVAMGVGLVLFWPALFFMEGDSPQAHEYTKLKGEYEALEKAAIEKKCSIDEENPFTKVEEEMRKAQEEKEKNIPAYPSSRK